MLTKLAHKVVIYGTVLAVVAIGVSDAVAAGVSAKRNTESAPAAVTVEANRDIKVVGFDANDDAKTAVEAGEMLATVAQQPKLIGSLGAGT